MKQFKLVTALLAGTLTVAAPVAQADNVTIEVGYPYSALFDVTFERMMPTMRMLPILFYVKQLLTNYLMSVFRD